MNLRCNKCGRRLEGQPCTYCPDPAQRLLALQSRVTTSRPPRKKQHPRAHWWTSKWKPKTGTETVSGQDAALPKGDR